MAFEYEDEDDKNWFQRNGGLTIGGVVVLVAVGLFFGNKLLPKGGGSPRESNITMVALPPPPPPPPPRPIPTPPPQQQPTPEQDEKKPMEQQETVQDEKKEEAPKEKPDEPAPLGTNIAGPGGDSSGLAFGGGGGGGYGSGGGGQGSKSSWYASGVQNRVREALASNTQMRKASASMKARIWVDQTGRITRARVSGGDDRTNTLVQNDILTGLQLSDPPPPDMPMPIVMMVTAKRPH